MEQENSKCIENIKGWDTSFFGAFKKGLQDEEWRYDDENI